jgi:carbamoyltransferase
MNILGINISHNCSIAFYKNKILTDLYEEERFNNLKFFNPITDGSFLICLDEKLNFKPDVVCYSSYGRTENKDFKIIKNIQKQLNHPKYYFDKQDHHIHHACCGYYFSKYDEAMAIVVDGGGAHDKNHIGYQEMESIFYISKNKILKKYQHKSNRRFCIGDPAIYDYSKYAKSIYENGTEYLFSSQSIGGFLFTMGCFNIGLKTEPGKLMGLASYSKTNKNFNLNKDKINTAQKIQEISFERTCWLIEKAFRYKKIKNFVLTGGYFQNCSNNFKYIKKYPEFNFFVDPVPHDGGTAIGVCFYYENYI